MKRKLVDPIHLFNEGGLCHLNQQHLEAEIARLTAENEILRDRIARQAERMMEMGIDESETDFEPEMDDEFE